MTQSEPGREMSSYARIIGTCCWAATVIAIPSRSRTIVHFEGDREGIQARSWLRGFTSFANRPSELVRP